MIFVYRVENNDKIEDIDLQFMMRKISNSETWAFEELDAKGFWDCESLNFTDKTEDCFIVYDTVTGYIKKMYLTFGIEVIDEEVLFRVNSEKMASD